MAQPQQAPAPAEQIPTRANPVDSYISIRVMSKIAVRGALQKEFPSPHVPENNAMVKLHDTAWGILARHDSNPVVAEAVDEIYSKNSLNGIEITEPMGRAVTRQGVAEKMTRMLELYEQDPEVAGIIAERRISGFHGSGSGTLIDVLKHDLLTEKEAMSKLDIVMVSGEREFSPVTGQEDISFVDWAKPRWLAHYTFGRERIGTVADMRARANRSVEKLDEVIGHYGENSRQANNMKNRISDNRKLIKKIEANQDPQETELILADFPVAYGISADDFKVYETIRDVPKDSRDKPGQALVRRVRSSIDGEFRTIDKSVPVEKIHVVAVPENKIDMVRELIETRSPGHDITIIPLESVIS